MPLIMLSHIALAPTRTVRQFTNCLLLTLTMIALLMCKINGKFHIKLKFVEFSQAKGDNYDLL